MNSVKNHDETTSDELQKLEEQHGCRIDRTSDIDFSPNVLMATKDDDAEVLRGVYIEGYWLIELKKDTFFLPYDIRCEEKENCLKIIFYTYLNFWKKEEEIVHLEILVFPEDDTANKVFEIIKSNE